MSNKKIIKKVLAEALTISMNDTSGQPASYIPELANVPVENTCVSATLNDGTQIVEGNCPDYVFTLQSVAKVVVLIGLLEEFGKDRVFSRINVEPSGRGFAAIDYLDRFVPTPSNPMVNAGAITLCSHVPGENHQERLIWLENWMKVLFNDELKVNYRVYESERETSDRNRSLAYLMRSNGTITGDVDSILQTYTALCSFEANIRQASYLSMLLANHGLNEKGERILSEETIACVIPIMTTCGLYDESGIYLVNTGMPAKSGVSGLIIASALGDAGLAVYSPRINEKGGSIRGHIMLQYIAKKLNWHFALRSK